MYCNLSLAQIIKALNKCDDHDYIDLWNSLCTLHEHGLIPTDFWQVLYDLDGALFFDE